MNSTEPIWTIKKYRSCVGHDGQEAYSFDLYRHNRLFAHCNDDAWGGGSNCHFAAKRKDGEPMDVYNERQQAMLEVGMAYLWNHVLSRKDKIAWQTSPHEVALDEPLTWDQVKADSSGVFLSCFQDEFFNHLIERHLHREWIKKQSRTHYLYRCLGDEPQSWRRVKRTVPIRDPRNGYFEGLFIDMLKIKLAEDGNTLERTAGLRDRPNLGAPDPCTAL